MSNWDFSRQSQLDAELSNFEEYFGMVYVIRHKETGYYYIGQKKFWRVVKYPPLKGNTNKRHVKRESDWQNYWGSSELFLLYVEQEGEDNFERIVLQAVKGNLFDLNRAETEAILEWNGLDDPLCFNCLIRNVIRVKKPHLGELIK